MSWDQMQPICPDCREHDDGSRTCNSALSLCPLYMDSSSIAHILPVGDLIEHESDDQCICNPTSQPVPREDGSIGWIVVHHSLDGREMTEP